MLVFLNLKGIVELLNVCVNFFGKNCKMIIVLFTYFSLCCPVYSEKTTRQVISCVTTDTISVLNSVFISLTTTGNGGAVLSEVSDSKVLIESCAFYFCTAPSTNRYGGGMYISNAVSISLRYICGYRSYAAHSGMLYYAQSTDNTNLSVFKCSGYSCPSNSEGLAKVFCSDSGTLDVSYCNVSNSKVSMHTMIAAHGPSKYDLKFSTIINNRGNIMIEVGGYFSHSYSYLNVIDNTQHQSTYGLFYSNGAIITVYDSIIKNSHSRLIYCLNSAAITFDPSSKLNVYSSTIELFHLNSGYCNGNAILISRNQRYSTKMKQIYLLFLLIQ